MDTVPQQQAKREAQIEIKDVSMAFGSFVLMRDLNFTISKGDVFIIMGGSGSGKSTLLQHLIGLRTPARGDILYNGESFVQASARKRASPASVRSSASRLRSNSNVARRCRSAAK